MKYPYIVVEGSIGSGKSALSRRLADYFGSVLLPEMPQRNPFLDPFYHNAARHALGVQLAFLMQRVEAVTAILEAEGRGERVISDFLLEKDQIFAPIILNNEELNLYWQIRSRVMAQVPVPDLVIYLQASDEHIAKRIENHNAGRKNLFPEGYVRRVHDEYRRFFHLYDRAALLIANTDELDFIGNEDHFDMLLRAMDSMRGTRHYLNLSE